MGKIYLQCQKCGRGDARWYVLDEWEVHENNCAFCPKCNRTLPLVRWIPKEDVNSADRGEAAMLYAGGSIV
jgi:hypothetical protein